MCIGFKDEIFTKINGFCQSGVARLFVEISEKLTYEILARGR